MNLWRANLRTLLLAVAATALAASGCTTMVTGKGQLAANGASASGTPTPSRTPAAQLTPAVKLLRGKLREAHRLAGVVERPDLVFRQFDKNCAPTGTYYSLDALTAFGGVFPDNAIPSLREGGYVTGYSQCRMVDSGRSLIGAAFELKDAAACRTAIRKLAAALRAKGAKLFPIPGYPDSFAVEQANQKDYNDPTKKTNYVQRMVPVGSVLNYVWARSPTLNTARNGAARLLIAQLDRMKGFQVTPADKLPDLDDDPAGLRARRAELPGDLVPETGGYDPQQYLAMAEDPVFEKDLLTRDGMTEYFLEASTNKEGDRYVYRGVGLYQLRDAAAAQDVVAQFTDLDKRITQGIKIINVDGLPPGAFCFAKGDQFGQIDQRCFFNKGPVTVQVDVANATRKFTDVTELAKLVKAQFDKL